MAIDLSHIKTKYPDITDDELMDGIEVATMRTLEQLHGETAGAVIDEDGIHATLYKSSGFESINLPTLPEKSMRRLLNEIEIELMRRQVYSEANLYKTIRGSIQAGTIEHIYPDGTLLVHITFNDVLTYIELYGECPLPHQPKHERGTYSVGATMHFMITACLPVANERRAKIKIIASRAARELPSRMLSQLLGVPGITCTRRDPSGRSHITTKHDIPKKAVISVSDALNETIVVNWANRSRREPMIIMPTNKHTEKTRRTH